MTSLPSDRPAVCILTQYFPPEMGAPPVRLSELAERLAERGWDVQVLTAQPNYPTGKVFPGFPRFQVSASRVGHIPVVRTPLWPSSHGLAARVVTYASFAISATVAGARRCRQPDVIYAESPPLTVGAAGRWLARRWRCRFVLNVSDLWPQSAVEMGMVKSGPLVRLAARLEDGLYARADGVTGQSDAIVEHVRRRAPRTPTTVITNGVDPARFNADQVDDYARALIGGGEGPVFLYAGLFGFAQGLDQVLDLAASLHGAMPGTIVLVGDGPARARLYQRVEQEQLERVRILHAQPRERMPAVLAAADVALVTLGASITGAVPSKIYEAMAASLPILLVADGEAARRVEDAGCGLVVTPHDKDALVTAFTRLATDRALRERLGRAGRRAAETTYHRDRAADLLDQFLRRILNA
jgi:glycosyltransferase involved in cell wall biosynthesis